MATLNLNYLELLISPDNNRYFISSEASILRLTIQPKIDDLNNLPLVFDSTPINITLSDYSESFKIFEVESKELNNLTFNNNIINFNLTPDILKTYAHVTIKIIFHDIINNYSTNDRSLNIEFNNNNTIYNYHVNPRELYGIYLVGGSEAIHTSQIPLRITGLDTGTGENITLNSQNISLLNKSLIYTSINSKKFKISFRVMNLSSYELIEEKILLFHEFLTQNNMDSLKLFLDYNRHIYYLVSVSGEITKTYDGQYATWTLLLESTSGMSHDEQTILQGKTGHTNSNSVISPIIYIKNNENMGESDLVDNITGSILNITPNEDGCRYLIINLKNYTINAYTENGTQIASMMFGNIYLKEKYDLTFKNYPNANIFVRF